jgi:hypothetical protein
MFYKNMGHYKNTLIKIIREDYDLKVEFNSDKSLDFIHLCWLTSDREKKFDAGYDLLCCIKHFCESKSHVSSILHRAIDNVRSIDLDTEVDFQIYMDNLFSEIGYVTERSSF